MSLKTQSGISGVSGFYNLPHSIPDLPQTPLARAYHLSWNRGYLLAIHRGRAGTRPSTFFVLEGRAPARPFRHAIEADSGSTISPPAAPTAERPRRASRLPRSLRQHDRKSPSNPVGFGSIRTEANADTLIAETSNRLRLASGTSPSQELRGTEARRAVTFITPLRFKKTALPRTSSRSSVPFFVLEGRAPVRPFHSLFWRDELPLVRSVTLSRQVSSWPTAISLSLGGQIRKRIAVDVSKDSVNKQNREAYPRRRPVTRDLWTRHHESHDRQSDEQQWISVECLFEIQTQQVIDGSGGAASWTMQSRPHLGGTLREEALFLGIETVQNENARPGHQSQEGIEIFARQ